MSDLISRETLNETIDKITWYHINRDGDLVEGAFEEDDALYKAEDIYKAIDNTPTVEAFTKEDMAGAYNEGYACGGRESKRPQGEWIVKTKSTFPQYQPDEYECPFCKTIVSYKTNFCPKCGAKMEVNNG